MIIQGTAITGTTVSSSAATVDADSYFNLVTLLLPGNGTNGAQNNTFLDSSSNALTVTRSGNPTQGTFSPFSQTGWSNYFDGTGDYLSVGTTQLWTPSNDLTIEGWFNISTTGDRCIFSKDAGSSGPNRGIIIYITSTGAVSVFYSVTGSSEQFATSSTGLVVANQWYHLAVVKNGSSCAVYLNGVSVATFTAATIACPASQINYIGIYSGGAFLMLGYISNLRLVNGTAVYTANFTPPTAPLTAISGTSLLTCQSNRFIDNSTNAFAITAAGNTAVQAFAPFDPTAAYSTTTVGGSGYFDGTGDYLTISNPASLLTFGTGDFTIECFVYPTAASSSSYVCWIYGTTNVINAIIINSNTGAVTFRLRGTNLSETDVTSSSGLLRVGEWTHLALVRTGTNFYGYVNGTRFSTTIASNAAFNEAQAQFFTQPQIGAKSNTVGDYFTGYVSGWRALKGTALYTAATITVPSAPLTAIANTSALLNSTNGGITDAAAKNVLETVGNAQISTTQSKFGGSSMLFDGNADALLAPSIPINALGTGDFTIETWIRWSFVPNSGATYSYFFAIGGNTVNGMGLYVQNGKIKLWNTAEILAGSTTLSADTWYHVALVRSSGTVKLYLNGTQDGTVSMSSNLTGGVVNLGYWYNITDTNYFSGYIDDLRITKGYARYTTNFTPPTAAFPTQ
jgi:hypothetical protein